uniref:Otoancorin n=1 Tax=Eptatretus burgeri TaxID=7764 RepID=A0A8C4QNZ6_EPTBU
MDEILMIPHEGCPALISRLGKADSTLLPKSSPMRVIFQTKAMSCLDMTKPEVVKLGFLVCDISASKLSGIPNEQFKTLMPKLHACGTLSNEKATIVKRKLKTSFGNLGSWTTENILQVGPLLSVFTVNELSALPNTFEVGQALVDVVMTHTASESATSLPEFQRSWDLTLLEKAAFSRLFDTGSQTRKKRTINVECSEIQAPNSTMISTLKDLTSELTSNQLYCMSNSTFKSSVDVLGAVTGFNDSQRSALLARAKEAWSPHIEQWTEAKIYSLGQIVRGLTPVSLTFLKLSSIDAVSNLAGITGWETAQAQVIVTEYLKQSKSTMSSLSSTQLSGLGPLLCFQGVDRIALLDKTAYRCVYHKQRLCQGQ